MTIPHQRVAARLRTRSGPRTTAGLRAQELVQRNVKPIYEALIIAIKSSAREHDIGLNPCEIAQLASDVTPLVLRLPYEKHAPRHPREMPFDPTQVQLTTRELQALMGAARGLSAQQTGYRLGITHDTVKSHLRTAYAKLRARNAPHAVAICIKYRLLQPTDLADI